MDQDQNQTWLPVVDAYVARVEGLYPPGYAALIADARDTVFRIPVPGRKTGVEWVRDCLRVAHSFYDQPDALGYIFGDRLESPLNLFLTDHLLRLMRRSQMEGFGFQGSPGDHRDERRLWLHAVLQLNALQYHAEMFQDVLVGIRDA